MIQVLTVTLVDFTMVFVFGIVIGALATLVAVYNPLKPRCKCECHKISGVVGCGKCVEQKCNRLKKK